VWSFASSAAIGNTVAGSPKRGSARPRAMAADADVDRRVGVHHLPSAEVARKGVGAACVDRAPSGQAGGEAGRDSAEAAGDVDETVADILGSFLLLIDEKFHTL